VELDRARKIVEDVVKRVEEKQSIQYENLMRGTVADYYTVSDAVVALSLLYMDHEVRITKIEELLGKVGVKP